MAATVPSPLPSEPLRFSMRLPGPLWIGLAAVVLIVMAIGLQFGLPIYRQQKAIQEIKRLRGEVEVTKRLPVWLKTMFGEERMDRLEDVVAVHLSGTRIANAGLADLTVLSDVEVLDLGSTRITDEGLAPLRRLKRLESYNVSGTRVSDAGLVHLKGLTALGCLFLCDTKTTEAGIADLKRALPGLMVEK
jgi:hypothetical protein